jgi:tetratricopeptide (TPR) repeat protein
MESLAILDELIEEQTEVAEAYISRASILDTLGKHREALQDCSKALKLASTGKQYLYPSIYEQKMILLLTLKLHKACKQLLSDAAIELEMDDFDYLLNAYQNQLSKRRIKLKEEQITLAPIAEATTSHRLRLVKA